MLACRDLSFRYKEQQVLRNISFSVEPGTFCALLGRNGAGKTTLLHCLGGICRPESGTVTMDGRDLFGLGRRELARLVGLVPQEHTDIFPFRVIEVVVMGRTPHLSFGQSPGDRDYAMAAEVLDSLGYGHLAGRSFNRISGGERRITLLARALLQTGKTLLFDEPTNHLDFHNQHLVLDRIRTVCRELGARVIASMHDPNLAALFADQVVLLRHGEILAQGDTGKVMTAENLSLVYETPTDRLEHPGGHCMYLPRIDSQ